eukprot:TRINITY_DN26501_c1_g1_i1.p1 TRINITY_DN26501_c1_g1~~TRINITY_DN26501_c1_g1_i1.p1  ORF type:complete len:252 (-),score=54.58 TRINITY_DN26501_c1_g1_i1:147-881(-)
MATRRAASAGGSRAGSAKRARGGDVEAEILAQVLHEKKHEEKLKAALSALPAGTALPVTMVDLSPRLLPLVDRLHRKGLPIRYGPDFYNVALRSKPWAKVALWEGCVVGAIICQVSEETDSCVHVKTLVSAWSRRKIASQLLQAILAEARRQGLSRCSLRVHVRNESAVALYKSLGFSVRETLINYYRYSADKLEAPPDAFFMMRDTGLRDEDAAFAELPCLRVPEALSSDTADSALRKDCGGD